MTTWTDLFPDPVRLISRHWYTKGSTYTLTVPAKSTHARILVSAAGGQGADGPGGGGAFARAKILVTPAENFTIQVGRPGSQSTTSDSSVVRASNNTVVAYADRGRGSGYVQGLAANSTGDYKISGLSGNCQGDAADPYPLGFDGHAWNVQSEASEPGGGGYGAVVWGYDGSSQPIYGARPSGHGMVCVEFYEGNPPYA